GLCFAQRNTTAVERPLSLSVTIGPAMRFYPCPRFWHFVKTRGHKRNFSPTAVVQFGEGIKDREVSHAHVPPLVHPLRILLAAGDPGSGSLPVHLAAPAPVPHHRRRRPRTPGDHLPRHHTPLPPASRPVPDLMGGTRPVRI